MSTNSIFCSNCGTKISKEDNFCSNCGNVQNINQISNKSSLIALFLCAFLGLFGVHRLYIGKITSGIMMLVFTIIGVFSFVSIIWTVIDLIRIMANDLKDINNKTLVTNHKKWFIASCIAIILIIITTFILTTTFFVHIISNYPNIDYCIINGKLC